MRVGVRGVGSRFTYLSAARQNPLRKLRMGASLPQMELPALLQNKEVNIAVSMTTSDALPGQSGRVPPLSSLAVAWRRRKFCELQSQRPGGVACEKGKARCSGHLNLPRRRGSPSRRQQPTPRAGSQETCVQSRPSRRPNHLGSRCTPGLGLPGCTVGLGWVMPPGPRSRR